MTFPETCRNMTCGESGFRCADPTAPFVEVCSLTTMTQEYKLRGESAEQTGGGFEHFYTRGVANHESFQETYNLCPGSYCIETCKVEFSGNPCVCEVCKQDAVEQLLGQALKAMPPVSVDCAGVEGAESFAPLTCVPGLIWKCWCWMQM